MKNVPIKHVPLILQTDVGGGGLASLAMIASHFGFKTSLEKLNERFQSTEREMSLAKIMQFASSLHLDTRALRIDLNQIIKLKLPCILHWDKTHFVVLREIQYDYRKQALLVLLDPAFGERKIYAKNASVHFAGIALEFSIKPSFAPSEECATSRNTTAKTQVISKFSVATLREKFFHFRTLVLLGICNVALIPSIQRDLLGSVVICELALFLYFFVKNRNTETIIPSERNLARGFEYLTEGNLRKGWELYEWRWKTPLGQFAVRKFEQPRWDGQSSLQNKSILIYWEQGLGDTIQFSRYIKMIANLGAKVYFEVQPPLVKLLRDIEGVTEVIESGRGLPKFDFHCPLLSLPRIFETELESIPNYLPYLRPKIDDLNIWNLKLGNKKKPRVGIVWSGNINHSNDQNRSIPLALLIKYLSKLSHLEYFSLQREVRPIDQPVLDEHPQIRHFGDQLNDFADTAALCELMDVVISVDTSVAHLSAAIGRTTFVLLPYIADWRWLEARSDSPWYKSVKLFRQHKANNWNPVMEQLVLYTQDFLPAIDSNVS